MKNNQILRMLRSLPLLAAALVLGGLLNSGAARAGTIILEGSDAIGYHSNDNAAAGAYRDQVWSAIGGADSRSIAVIGGPVSAGTIISNTHAITRLSDLTAAGTLSDYVALYFLAGGGCCQEDDTLPAGHEADILAYLAAGGTVMIENYTGGTAWDFAIGTGGTGNGHVAGVGGGASSSLNCSDGETVTADGISNGFTQPSAMSCWTHQAYDMGYFSGLGFTRSFFDSPTGLGYPTSGPWSSLLSAGTTVSCDPADPRCSPSVPEPASLTLMGLGLAGIGAARRRKKIS